MAGIKIILERLQIFAAKIFTSNNMKRYMHDVSRKVRLVDTSEFDVQDYSEFYGFICGVISNNFDISNFYVDSLFKIVNNKTDGMECFFKGIESLSKKFHISFVFSISIEPADVPEYLKKYI